MFLKTLSTIARVSLFVLPVAALATVNCGGSDSGGKGGSTGTAGATGTAGTGSGGSTGTGGSGTIACTPVSPTAADVTIMDWETAKVGDANSSFGMYQAGTYGGGTFQYPGPISGACDPTIHLCPNFDGKNWHITGTVHDYSGFGIYFNMGVIWDVSMFAGVSFDISGTFTAGSAGAAPAASVTMNVTDLRHEVDSAHTADSRATCGTCVPSGGSEYDGSCVAPSKVITLTSTPTTMTVKWNDLTDGRRPPNFQGESPDPTQISHIAWVLPWTGATAAPYTIDITVDNLKYLTN